MTFPQAYAEAIGHLERGDLERASRLSREFRETDFKDGAFLRRLINQRLQLKAGVPAWKDEPNLPEDPFLRAEYFFVRGISSFNRVEWKAGAADFRRAAAEYKISGKPERALLSDFNALIGSLNDSPPSADALLRDLDGIARQAREKGSSRVLGLALRQKCYLFLELRKFFAGAKYAREAVEALGSADGPKSDLDLARLAQAIAEFGAGRKDAAYECYEEVLLPVEPRLEWARAVTASILGVKDAPVPDPGRFSFVDPFFLEQHQLFREEADPNSSDKKPAATWCRRSGKLTRSDGVLAFRVKPASLEAQLLTLLTASSRTKTALIECLYPGAGDTGLVDNRLHRLVSRLNRRWSGLVVYRQRLYRLAVTVK